VYDGLIEGIGYREFEVCGVGASMLGRPSKREGRAPNVGVGK
jgi:hypothetical protein